MHISGTISFITLNTIQFITIASLGNAADFGDIVASRWYIRCWYLLIVNSWHHFWWWSPSSINEINSITIGTTGDSVDFGDLSAAKVASDYPTATSNSRGVVAGGDNSGAVNVIEFITIASIRKRT